MVAGIEPGVGVEPPQVCGHVGKRHTSGRRRRSIIGSPSPVRPRSLQARRLRADFLARGGNLMLVSNAARVVRCRRTSSNNGCGRGWRSRPPRAAHNGTVRRARTARSRRATGPAGRPEAAWWARLSYFGTSWLGNGPRTQYGEKRLLPGSCMGVDVKKRPRSWASRRPAPTVAYAAINSISAPDNRRCTGFESRPLCS